MKLSKKKDSSKAKKDKKKIPKKPRSKLPKEKKTRLFSSKKKGKKDSKRGKKSEKSRRHQQETPRPPPPPSKRAAKSKTVSSSKPTVPAKIKLPPAPPSKRQKPPPVPAPKGGPQKKAPASTPSSKSKSSHSKPKVAPPAKPKPGPPVRPKPVPRTPRTPRSSRTSSTQTQSQPKVAPPPPPAAPKAQPPLEDTKTLRLQTTPSTETTATSESTKTAKSLSLERQKTKVRNLVDTVIQARAAARDFNASILPTAASHRLFDLHPHKNRFQDVVCLDQSRVALPDGGYIHANWVNISDKKKVIVTQLPLAATVVDFWKMIFHERVKGIVLFLSQHEWCSFVPSNFLPNHGEFIHVGGGIVVGELQRLHVTPLWKTHILSLQIGNETREVHLHAFKDWVHGLQPGNLDSIWKLISTFRHYQDPHVYMSLSGAGRAGTFAVLQMAHTNLHDGSKSRIGVDDCLRSVRNQRASALQTREQFIFVWLALTHHVLQHPMSTVLFPSDYHQRTLTYFQHLDKLRRVKPGPGDADD